MGTDMLQRNLIGFNGHSIQNAASLEDTHQIMQLLSSKLQTPSNNPQKSIKKSDNSKHQSVSTTKNSN